MIVSGIIAADGEQTSWRYIEFFTANTRNPIRTGLMRGLAPAFLPGTDAGDLRLLSRPFDVAAYVQRLQARPRRPASSRLDGAQTMVAPSMIVPLNSRASGRRQRSKQSRVLAELGHSSIQTGYSRRSRIPAEEPILLARLVTYN